MASCRTAVGVAVERLIGERLMGARMMGERPMGERMIGGGLAMTKKLN